MDLDYQFKHFKRGRVLLRRSVGVYCYVRVAVRVRAMRITIEYLTTTTIYCSVGGTQLAPPVKK